MIEAGSPATLWMACPFVIRSERGMTPAASDGRMISSADGKGQLRNLQATDLKNSRSRLGSDLTPMLAAKQSWKLDFPEDTIVADVQADW